MRAFIKSFKFGNVNQTMFMNKLFIENQTNITISVVKLDLTMLKEMSPLQNVLIVY